jgi:4-amino-4-deoxy-L-arabinose transferase-like glycosyltransferase
MRDAAALKYLEAIAARASSNFLKSALSISLFAFALRMVLRVWQGSAEFWTNGYVFFLDLAQNIAAGHGYAFPGQPPTAFRVPLYPIFLATVTGGERNFWTLAIAHSLIGAATVLCTALLAREFFDARTGLLAGLITAIYPYYAVHDVSLSELGLFTFLTVLAMLLLAKARRVGSPILAGCAGAAVAAAILTRATLAPFALFAFFWIGLAAMPRIGLRKRLTMAVTYLAAVMGLLSPWLIHAHELTGSYTLGTEFGSAVFTGNHPTTFLHYPEQSIDLSRAAAFASLSTADHAELSRLRPNEMAVSNWYLQRGVTYILAHPFEVTVGGLRKNIAAFGWLPSPRHGLLGNLVYFLSYGPILILGIWGVWLSRRQWREHSLVYGQFFSFAGVTAVLWGHTSHRSFLDVYLIIFAASALSIQFFRSASSTERQQA